MKYKNLVYFLNGSIGDFLMALFFMENIHENDSSIALYVVTPRNKKAFDELSEAYPYITVVEANRRSFRGMAASIRLLRFMSAANLVVTPPTPGRLPTYIKIVAKLAALYPGSLFVGFKDGGWGNYSNK